VRDAANLRLGALEAGVKMPGTAHPAIEEFAADGYTHAECLAALPRSPVRGMHAINIAALSLPFFASNI
jgi:hypothetical protein